MTSASVPTRRIYSAAGVIGAVAVIALLVSLTVAGGTYQPAAPGLPDQGSIIGWGLPLIRFAADAAGILTCGWLLSAAFLAPHATDGTVSRPGRSDIRRAAIAAGVWSILLILQMFFDLGYMLGIPASKVFNASLVSTYAWDLEPTRALIFSAILAVAVLILASFTSRIGTAAVTLVVALGAMVLPQTTGHGAHLGDHALAMTAGIGHMVAAVIWIGGLAALAVHAVMKDMTLSTAAKRFGVAAMVAVILLIASGAANAYVRLDTIDQIVTTGYGQVVLLKTLIAIALVAVAWKVRVRIIPSLDGENPRRQFAKYAFIDLVLMGAALGAGVALSMSPPPRIPSELPSIGEQLLGFLYPAAPDTISVLFGFHLDPLFFVGCLVAAGLYVYGVFKLRERGIKWPLARTIWWLLGIATVIWVTNAGIAVYAQVSVGLHMLQHMTMTMLAPIFLVLGAPLTLALRALPTSRNGQRGVREWIMWLLHSPITIILTNPIYVFFVYVIGLYALYLTPLFGFLMGSHIGHIVMMAHFLISGYLFAWVVIGVDPMPRPLPYWGKFLLLLLGVAVHAFFAVALMMGDQPLAPEWFSVVRPPWITDPAADSALAGQLAWGLSEVPMLLMVIMVALQWSRSDDREAKRKDRQADRDGDAELNAYNEYLASLEARNARKR